MAYINFANVSAQVKTDTVGKTSIHKVSSKYKGLQVGRSDLVAAICSIDSTIKFKDVPNGNSFPKLSARAGYGTRIEITGTENNVTSVQWKVIQLSVAPPNRIAFTRMAFFVNILCKQPGTSWLFDQLYQCNKNPALPVAVNTTLDGNRLLFVYDNVKKVFTLTVSAQ